MILVHWLCFCAVSVNSLEIQLLHVSLVHRCMSNYYWMSNDDDDIFMFLLVLTLNKVSSLYCTRIHCN